ncbi:MAG: SDR family oxidoreductase [bacterium]
MNLLQSFSLKNKFAIVTGSRGALGMAIINALENAGAKVFAYGISAGYDVTDIKQINKVISKLKRVDILVNNAGVTNTTWDKTYEVNLKAPFVMATTVRKKMKKGASIINISSINAELAFPNNPSYVAMKHGLNGLTKALARDFGKYGIRVNGIGPGYFRTEMTKQSWQKRHKEIADKTILGRWGIPEDLMGTVVLLASRASSYITGQTIYIDGGWLAKGL